MILTKCGTELEDCEGLGARSTGGAIKSAVVDYWRSKGYSEDYRDSDDRKFSGNLGKHPENYSLIKVLYRRKNKASRILRKKFIKKLMKMSVPS